MLNLVEGSRSVSRRTLLQVGTGFAGIGLAHRLAIGANVGASAVKDRAVVVLNLQGGPTQYETFDPKMTAPAEIRSITGEVQTSLAGITFGGTFPQLARLADQMAVIRSYRHGISSHGPAAKHVMAGGNSTGAMMGALFARIAGVTDPLTGMPQNALVTPRTIGDQHKALYANVERVSQTGSLPTVYKPFDPSSGGELLQNMELRIGRNRLADRRSLLQRLDQLRRAVDSDSPISTAGNFQLQAFDVLSRGISTAFDLSKESDATIARYDTSHMEPTDGAKKRNAYAAQFSPVALGKQMLLARRLCEAGCGFVTVTCGGWDMHGGGKEFMMRDGIASLTPAVDKAASAFIEDVIDRGLTDKILLVITGEFGRTPRINKNGGRDHWGNLCPVAFVGGGLRMGQVVGQSDRIAGEPASAPISSGNVLATIMHALFDIGTVRVLPAIPKDVETAVTGPQPITELV